MPEDREVIVTNDGGGSGAGMIIAVVLLLVVVVGLFLLYQNGTFSGGATDVKADININPPAKTN